MVWKKKSVFSDLLSTTDRFVCESGNCGQMNQSVQKSGECEIEIVKKSCDSGECEIEIVKKSCDSGECEINTPANGEYEIIKTYYSLDLLASLDHVDGFVNTNKETFDSLSPTDKFDVIRKAKLTKKLVQTPLCYEHDFFYVDRITSPYFFFKKSFQENIYPDLLKNLDYSYNIGSQENMVFKLLFGNIKSNVNVNDKIDYSNKIKENINTSILKSDYNNIFITQNTTKQFMTKLKLFESSSEKNKMLIDTPCISGTMENKLKRNLLSFNSSRIKYMNWQDLCATNNNLLLTDYVFYNFNIFNQNLINKYNNDFFANYLKNFNSPKLVNSALKILEPSYAESYSYSSAFIHDFLCNFFSKPNLHNMINEDRHNMVANFALKNSYLTDFENKQAIKLNFLEHGIIDDILKADTQAFFIWEIFYNDILKTAEKNYNYLIEDYLFKFEKQTFNFEKNKLNVLTSIYKVIIGFCNASIVQISWIHFINLLLISLIFFILMDDFYETKLCKDLKKMYSRLDNYNNMSNFAILNNKKINLIVLVLCNLNFFLNYFKNLLFKNNFFFKISSLIYKIIDTNVFILNKFKNKNNFNSNINLNKLNILHISGKKNVWKPIFKRKSYLGFFFSNNNKFK